MQQIGPLQTPEKYEDYMFNNNNFTRLYLVLKRLIYPKFLMEKGSENQFKMHLNN